MVLCYFFPKSLRCGLDDDVFMQIVSIRSKFDALAAISQGGCALHCPECDRSRTPSPKVAKCEAFLLGSRPPALPGEALAHVYASPPF